MPNKTIAFVQARMGSIRLPGKMTMKIGGFSILEWVLRRVRLSTQIDEVILVTSLNSENDALIAIADSLSIPTFRGDEMDVLSRFYKAANSNHADVIVRICADNPFIEASEIDRIITHRNTENADYAFNHIPRLDNQYVDGLGAEVMTRKTLNTIWNSNPSTDQREHVTEYIWDNPDQFKIVTIKAPEKYIGEEIKLDIDSVRDFEKMTEFFGWMPVDSPELFPVDILIKKIKRSK